LLAKKSLLVQEKASMELGLYPALAVEEHLSILMPSFLDG